LVAYGHFTDRIRSRGGQTLDQEHWSDLPGDLEAPGLGRQAIFIFLVCRCD